MLDKIREMIRLLPPAMAAVVRHAVLTGLRPVEAVESVRLVLQNVGNDTLRQYYNPECQCLEHFRFSEIFCDTPKRLHFLSQRGQLTADCQFGF